MRRELMRKEYVFIAAELSEIHGEHDEVIKVRCLTLNSCIEAFMREFEHCMKHERFHAHEHIIHVCLEHSCISLKHSCVHLSVV